MSSSHQNLSSPSASSYPSADQYTYGIVVSQWNETITQALYQGAIETLQAHGVPESQIHTLTVPGSFELPLGAKHLLQTTGVHAVICLGCVIQGETRHFDFICSAVADHIMSLGLEYMRPVIFGVLTTQSLAQAEDRSGGRYGNKGIEAASTALSLLTQSLRS